MKTPKEEAIHQETKRKQSKRIKQQSLQETKNKQTIKTPKKQAIHQETKRTHSQQQ